MKIPINLTLYVLAAGIVFSTSAGHAALPVTLEELPPGPLRTGMERLPEAVRKQALARMAELSIPSEDLPSLRVHPRGELFYVCAFELAGEAGGLPGMANPVVITGAVSTASPPAWHSRPGSSNVLFLDFNGGVISNTAWNSYPDFGMIAAWDCRPYGLDGDETLFSIAEQEAMRVIWERVAEDYAPFDVDVTTEQPPVWSPHTGHVLITPDTDKNGVACPHEGAGGIAFVDVFGQADYSYNYPGECYSPAWVLNYELPGYAEFEAEAAAHEMGHNLALSHDGNKTAAYYSGHENGSISWGPIMGTGYNRNVSQWSKGDYRLANNTEDDLAIIAARLSYFPDDFGDGNPASAPLAFGADGAVMQRGVIGRTLDEDVFRFTVVSGAVVFAASPYRDPASTTWGGNLDIVMELQDEAGLTVATNNPPLETTASLNAVLHNGTYYLHIRSTGVGDPFAVPLPSGYVRYGSIGQYALSGMIPIDPDLDGDGLPNVWEDAYFGGMTNASAGADDDGDGADNTTEYVGGYNPTNAASMPMVSVVPSATPDGRPFVLVWNAVTGRLYSVGWTEDLNQSFTNISGALPYPVDRYTDTVDRAESHSFYRLGVQIAP